MVALWAIVSYIYMGSVLSAGWLAEVCRCCQVTLSFIVLMGYWRAATACFFIVGRWPQKQKVIALGIWLSWFSIWCNASWAILFRLSGQPSWMLNNDFYTAWTAVSSFAAALHILAPNLIGPNMPEMDRAKYGSVAALGFTLAIVVGVWRPDLSPIAEFFHVLIMEPHQIGEWLRGLALFAASPFEVNAGR